MKVAILRSGGVNDKKVERILGFNKINGDFIDKITRNTLMNYDFLVISPTKHINNLPKVIEQIVLEDIINVVFVSNTLNIGQYYNVMNSIRFNFVSNLNMESELIFTLSNTHKYINIIKNLELENNKLKDQVLLIKLTNKAKRVLMTKGFSEEESHHFIQKKAMDMRISKKKLVNLIIQNRIDF